MFSHNEQYARGILGMQGNNMMRAEQSWIFFFLQFSIYTFHDICRIVFTLYNSYQIVPQLNCKFLVQKEVCAMSAYIYHLVPLNNTVVSYCFLMISLYV